MTSNIVFSFVETLVLFAKLSHTERTHTQTYKMEIEKSDDGNKSSAGKDDAPLFAWPWEFLGSYKVLKDSKFCSVFFEYLITSIIVILIFLIEDFV